jgi:hypothetical protein
MLEKKEHQNDESKHSKVVFLGKLIVADAFPLLHISTFFILVSM